MGSRSRAEGPVPALETTPTGVCRIIGGMLRLGAVLAALLAVVAAAAELGLRVAGVRPRTAAEPSNVVPDGWTGFRLRPGVSGEEPFVTNDLGMHAPRSYALTPAPGTLRVAVLGSSVVYGMNVALRDTIPAAIERELQSAGHRAEVLNFGIHAFGIVNVSALLQAYVHQFRPDVVVTVVDLQVGLARWPDVRPGTAPQDEGIARLGWREALLERGARKSVVLGLLQDPRPARRWIRQVSGLPLRPRPANDLPPPATPASAAAAAANVDVPGPPED